MDTFESVIERISSDPETHARWLNTLSLLEYIGARKILKSLHEDRVSNEVLAHAAEEIRHAQTFKKMALKMSKGRLDSYHDAHLLCGQAAKYYIQGLDQAVAQALSVSNPWTNYLLTTLLIEERANLLYPFYEPILARCGFPGYLKAIVREEDAHLQDIHRHLERNTKKVPPLEKLREIEAILFSSFMNAIHATL